MTIGAQTTPHATSGLSAVEAAERLARDGANLLPQPAPIRLWQSKGWRVPRS
ncbi:cation-transporting P-type ATPase [Nocardia vulneris]|uniref:cation-transporting P-type ATPase n=1 Tax=Nocardia vulneris TaxID=1141657 RepID=UPI003BB047B8